MVVKYFYSKIIHLILVELCFLYYNSAEAVRQSDRTYAVVISGSLTTAHTHSTICTAVTTFNDSWFALQRPFQLDCSLLGQSSFIFRRRYRITETCRMLTFSKLPILPMLPKRPRIRLAPWKQKRYHSMRLWMCSSGSFFYFFIFSQHWQIVWFLAG